MKFDILALSKIC